MALHVRFTPSAHKDYLYWKRHDPKVAQRIHALCRDILRKPFEGMGKPEPLKFDLQGWWSRRIDRTHRLVYQVRKDELIILSCRYHY